MDAHGRPRAALAPAPSRRSPLRRIRCWSWSIAPPRESGLGTALTSSEPQGQGKLRVRLEKAQFDILMGWLARFSDQHGISIESATVDNAGAPGVVNAGLVLQVK